MQDVTIRKVLEMTNRFRPTSKPIYCNNCGTKLKVYYAEGRVFAVKCGYCEYIGIAKGGSYDEAALHFGNEKGGAE